MAVLEIVSSLLVRLRWKNQFFSDNNDACTSLLSLIFSNWLLRVYVMRYVDESDLKSMLMTFWGSSDSK